MWDSDFLDLVEEAHLTFQGKSDCEIAFGALKGFLDVRYGTRDGSACAEFSWEGHDENDPSCGRGWAMIGTARRLVSTMATIRPSFANAAEFFSLLEEIASSIALFGGRPQHASRAAAPDCDTVRARVCNSDKCANPLLH